LNPSHLLDPLDLLGHPMDLPDLLRLPDLPDLLGLLDRQVGAAAPQPAPG
jgi:hypothetical protein